MESSLGSRSNSGSPTLPIQPRADRLAIVTEQTSALLSTALELSISERAELAAELLASLDGEPDADVEAAWAAEIERRARRVLAEGSRGRPWEDVRDDLRRRL